MSSSLSVKINGSDQLIAKAERLLALGKESEEVELIVPSLLTIAIALEALLNDAIVSTCFKIYPESDYKSIAESYLTMSLKGKLNVAIPIATKSKYIINKQSSVYQSLTELITIRNQLAHTKSFVGKLSFSNVEADGDNGLKGDAMEIDSEWYYKQFKGPLYSSTFEQAEICLSSIKCLSSCLLVHGAKDIEINHDFVKRSKA